MFWVSSLHTASGADVSLEPPVASDQVLEDLRRRCAYALQVGIRQVTLLSGSQELLGNCLVADVINESTAQDLTVVLQPVLRAYRPQLRAAWKSTGFVKLKRVAFPPSSGIDINMLPFTMGWKASLPAIYHGYWPLIQACELPKEEIGKVGFLTIQESDVPSGHAQRRPGLHLETPGVVMSEGRVLLTTAEWGGGLLGFEDKQRKEVPQMRLVDDLEEKEKEPSSDSESEEDPIYGRTGIYVHTRFQGGIYTASTVENSTRLWNLRFQEPAEISGPLGDLEHLREVLGPGEVAKAETLYWMSDATPHESMPLLEDTHRQYFRLVTSSVSLWYSKHSTENPLVKPDEKVTRIIDTDKFNDFAGRSDAFLRAGDELWDVRREHLGLGREQELLETRLGSLDEPSP
eukprot:Skav224114  [mRNA]  locus=scaffold2427:168159:169367:- [translate_table: standard]